MKQWAPQVIVVVALAVLALYLRGGDRLPESPETAVASFFEAGGKGDDAAYLRLVTGTLRTTLENTRSELGAAAFRDSLRRTAAGLKGIATTRVADAPEGQAIVEVELVFADRNERQRITLLEQSGGWALSAISTTDMVRPPVNYGSPVFDDSPQPPAAKPKPAAEEPG